MLVRLPTDYDERRERDRDDERIASATLGIVRTADARAALRADR